MLKHSVVCVLLMDGASSEFLATTVALWEQHNESVDAWDDLQYQLMVAVSADFVHQQYTYMFVPTN